MISKLFQENADIGYVYVSEQATYGSQSAENMRVSNDNNIFFIEFDAILHTFNEINRNQRMYTAENVWQNIQTEKIQSLIRDNSWFGEADHPMEKTQSEKLTPQRIQSIDWDRRTHIILNPQIKGDTLVARIKTVPGTDCGVGYAKDILGLGLVPHFSCRAIASLKIINGKPTVIIKRLITYDAVWYPSHARSMNISKPKTILKNIGTFTEAAASTIYEKANDVMIPLKEILSSVGQTDPTIQMVMESFDLPMNDLIGFDDNKTHAIIKDNDNMIYAKINPTTKHKVDDFFNSFK